MPSRQSDPTLQAADFTSGPRARKLCHHHPGRPQRFPHRRFVCPHHQTRSGRIDRNPDLAQRLWRGLPELVDPRPQPSIDVRHEALTRYFRVPISYFFADLQSDGAELSVEDEMWREQLQRPETIELIRLNYAISNPESDANSSR